MVSSHWDDTFAGRVHHRGPDVLIVERTPEHTDGVLLEERSRLRLALTGPQLALLGPAAGASAADVQALIADSPLSVDDPGLVHYLAPERASALSSAPPPEPAQVRVLGEQDRAGFEELLAGVPEDEQEEAEVDLDDWLVLGAFEGDRLVAVTSSYLQTEDIADIGVLTVPDARRRGHGLRLVAATCRQLLHRGVVPQYRADPANGRSLELARAAGFVAFGSWATVLGPPTS
ncbi:GNAT family N-acetyltransferase [Ruania suaedae]|uniref:GNAT family N-acetyltransferase n=1 Tax=Ruania suaedae TaxID=2897774 RepID=UPI001E59F9B6|nr:GNAT family N-acetyltransferase [Ruania suaedae]UFU02641.1 GNAT family N-acetyltransferase [Ruania suaedae]